MPTTTKLGTPIVHNIGVFYACYRLSRPGWKVMPTARDAKGIDIIANSPDAAHSMGAKVRSLSNKLAVSLGTTPDKIAGDWWIIMNDAVSDTPSTFIMLPDEVREGAHREKDHTYWLEHRDYSQERFRDAWHRLDAKSA